MNIYVLGYLHRNWYYVNASLQVAAITVIMFDGIRTLSIGSLFRDTVPLYKIMHACLFAFVKKFNLGNSTFYLKWLKITLSFEVRELTTQHDQRSKDLFGQCSVLTGQCRMTGRYFKLCGTGTFVYSICTIQSLF